MQAGIHATICGQRIRTKPPEANSKEWGAINQIFGDSSVPSRVSSWCDISQLFLHLDSFKRLASETPIPSLSKGNTAGRYDFGSSPIRCHGSQTPTVRQRLETHYFVALKLCIYQGIWLATDSSRKHSPPDKHTFPSGKPKMLAHTKYTAKCGR